MRLGATHYLALVPVILISVIVIVFSKEGQRDSPKAKDIALVSGILRTVLECREGHRTDSLPLQIEKLTSMKIRMLAITCRHWAEASTADPLGSLEDADRLKGCFFLCVKILKNRNDFVELRSVYYSSNIVDGWMFLWIEALGPDWHELLQIQIEDLD